MTPFSGSINLLEQLTEKVCLLDYWLVIKGYDSAAARQKCIGQGMWEGEWRVHAL